MSTDATTPVRARTAPRDRPGRRTCGSRKRRDPIRLEAGTHRERPGADRVGEIPLGKHPRGGLDRETSAPRTDWRRVGSRNVRTENGLEAGWIEKSPRCERSGGRSDRETSVPRAFRRQIGSEKSVWGAFGRQLGSQNVRMRSVRAPSRMEKSRSGSRPTADRPGRGVLAERRATAGSSRRGGSRWSLRRGSPARCPRCGACSRWPA
jgi:hypothetical protein